MLGKDDLKQLRLPGHADVFLWQWDNSQRNRSIRRNQSQQHATSHQNVQRYSLLSEPSFSKVLEECANHSKNRLTVWVNPKMGGTPKSSILVGFSIINHPAIEYWVPPFMETPIYIYIALKRQILDFSIK